MRFRDRQIKNIGDLVRSLKERAAERRLIWFRGQASAEWSLVPSLGRAGETPQAEIALIKRFKQNAVPYLASKPATEWEWLFLMQHYRLPTRLLDWSESPLAALFFAVLAEPDRDGALWCLDPVALNAHANINFRFDLEVPAFDYDPIIDNYLPSRLASEATTDLSPIAAIASRNSPRIAAQLGTFTITHRRHPSLETVGDGRHIWRLLIPAIQKQAIRQELSVLRFNSLTLFPELDKVAEEAREALL